MNCRMAGFILVMFSPLAAVSQNHDCLMCPNRVGMTMPAKGFVWLENEDFEGNCDAVPDTAWMAYRGRYITLYVHADGPEGSGRYWNITVGLSSADQTRPERGFCFITSTAGWRTLMEYDKTPLTWVEDENGDGEPELVIWDSFQISDAAATDHYGLVAWIYRVDRQGNCIIDWDLSRRKAFDIAVAYRRPVENLGPSLRELRLTAAHALEDFASGKCFPNGGPNH
jgi:hypothetical protein